MKQVFTGDPRLLHAGEANVVLLPVLGSHSVLLLDEDAHMAQRKLMLPPFHGERMRGYERDDGRGGGARDRALAGGRGRCGVADDAGDHARGDHADGLRRARTTARLERLAAALRAVLALGRPSRGGWRMLAVLGPARESRSAARCGRVLEPADELIYEEIRARRDAPDLAERDDVLSMLLQARHEDGSAMSDQELRDELMTLLVAGHETTRHRARVGARAR